MLYLLNAKRVDEIICWTVVGGFRPCQFSYINILNNTYRYILYCRVKVADKRLGPRLYLLVLMRMLSAIRLARHTPRVVIPGISRVSRPQTMSQGTALSSTVSQRMFAAFLTQSKINSSSLLSSY